MGIRAARTIADVQRRPRVCLVTSTHVSNNPRLVKEADALSQAGCHVRVVAVHAEPSLGSRDRELMRHRTWTLQRVEVAREERESAVRWLSGTLLQRSARKAFALGLEHASVRDQAASRFLRRLTAAVVSKPADMIIGHTLPALPVLHRAGKFLDARLGFDIEDLHSGELASSSSRVDRKLVESVERAWLPRCDFLVASSDGIADAVADMYGVPRPYVLYNVFPASDRLAAADTPAPRTAARSLYWYSQVIGPGRGLEEALEALAGLPDDVVLQLRGRPQPDFVARLEERARVLGVRDRLVLLEPAHPDHLVALAMSHDIGLALEQPATLNRRLCVTNKLFTYLLAGLGVAATDTPAQRAIMMDVPDAGFVYPPGDVDALRNGLASLLTNGAALRKAREAALRAALDRYCWERVQGQYVAFLMSHLPAAARQHAEVQQVAVG